MGYGTAQHKGDPKMIYPLKFKQDYNSESKRSPPSLPHLIIGNENEFSAHSL
jgi:hypothetical protein